MGPPHFVPREDLVGRNEAASTPGDVFHTLPLGTGAWTSLGDVLNQRRVLAVASDRAWSSVSGLFGNALDVRRFSDFRSNPTVESVVAAAAAVVSRRPACLIAVGGGSAIDVAKAARALAAGLPGDGLDGWEPLPRRHYAPLVVVPTLYGSGAEVTQFATMFSSSRKISLDDAALRPDIVFVDPKLSISAPLEPTSAAALDSMCHAIEASWSAGRTVVSLWHSEAALLALRQVRLRSNATPRAVDRARLAEAGINGGRAINIARTTAAHAGAYALTARYGIPHGIACALNMQWVSRMNASKLDELDDSVRVVKRGLRISLRELDDHVSSRLAESGWPTRLRDFGASKSEIAELCDRCMGEARMANNPYVPTRAEVIRYLRSIW